ncbi:MAG: hypothetical protein H0T88_09255 [Lysobacter sp.]|nr:hypothetical protein [Lysobacter sp.]
MSNTITFILILLLLLLAWAGSRPQPGVVEQIRVRAEGASIRRGIYRDFPTRYHDHRGNRVVVGFDVVEVRRNGEPEP